MLRRMTALVVVESLLLSLAPPPLVAEPVAPEVPPAASQPDWTRTIVARPGAASVLEIAGLRLEVPAGAVRKPTTITVTRLPVTERLGDGMANATAGTAAWRFEPHGTRFACGVRVTMPFAPSVLASEAAVSNLFTYFYDEGVRRWQRLERLAIDREAATVISVTDHFTDMIAATLRLPEGPSPIAFDPNEIKGLDAARPDAGVPAPEGLAAGPYGAAAFRIPLRVPPGRGAVSPGLALTYSSDAGATWLGRGFDVEVPRVAIDTRFGVPRYDGSDICLLDGEELVFAGSEGEARIYRARTERRFELIRWHTAGSESWWEVTDKAGVTREYGRGEAWIGPERGDRSRTFTWFLSKIRDPFGNTASWDYAHDAANRCTYLRAIRWAGYEDDAAREEGAYSVEFTLGAEERPDRRIDGRGGFSSKLARRLERISLRYRGSLVRAWVFHYRASETGQSLLASFTEQDAAGLDFYTYGFDYFALPERRDADGALLGYDGFGEREIRWAAEQDDRFTSLHQGVTTGAGASLYVGVRFFLPVPFFKKKTIAHFGVRAGAGVSQAMTKATLLDVNGDGLLDAAWREGSSLAAYLNTGRGFDLSQPIRLTGLSGRMDLEEQSSFSLGASAGLLGASGGVTRHRSWSEAQTGFADVNGDGFVDFVRKDEGAWSGHDGSSRFVEMPWTFGTAEAAGGPDPEADDYARSFYLQQPVRRLKIYRSGTVEVAQRVALAGAGSEDGASASTHFAGGTDTLVVNPVEPVARGSRLYDVSPGDSLYFRLETGDAEVGDDVDWNIGVRYRSLRYFEPLARAASFSPPGVSPDDVPFGDERLAPIYAAYGSDYRLVPGWQERDPATIAPVYDALIEHGLFVPRRASEPLFRKLLASCSRESVLQPDPGDPERTIAVRGDLLVKHAYRYVPELSVFERASGAADTLLMRHMPSLTLAERRGLALVRRPDGALVVPQGSDASARMRADAPAAEAPARLLLEGTLLDQSFDEEGRPLETLWLREESGTWRVWRSEPDGESEVEAAVSGAAPGNVTATFADRGVERSCSLSGWTSLLAELPEAIYEGPLSASVMDGEAISAYGIETLESAVYDALLEGASQAERDMLAACYALEGDHWRLSEPLDEGDRERLLAFVDGRAERDGSLFDVLPGDAAGALRIVAADAAEISALAAAAPAVAALFDDFGSPRADLTGDERAELCDALFRYRRDTEKLPFYTRDEAGGVRRLREDLSVEERAAAAAAGAAAGLGAWTRLQRAIVYRQSAVLPVFDAVLPEGAVAETLGAPGAHPAAAGDPAGLVLIPTFESSSGRTILRRVYVHAFDSLRDYAAEDLVSYPPDLFAESEEAGAEAPVGDTGTPAPEVFRGGANGWFYGVWTGYYAWNEALLYKTPPDPPEDTVTPPPYFTAMGPNRNGEGVVAITGDGEPQTPVPAEAWIGEVSAMSDARLDEQGAAVSEQRTFAAWICGDHVHPSRHGGDAYHRVPRGLDTGTPGRLGKFRSSRARSRDVNGGVGLGLLGADFSSNSGSSLQYRALLDLNGDRYPDLVSCPDDGGAFTVRPGTGQGFGDAAAWRGVSGSIARYETQAYGFGASVGSSAGGLAVHYDGKGEPDSFVVAQPSAGASIGANGTLGASVQTTGLLDCNGDGLPDLVQRDGGAYSVALNTGAGFAAPASWGDGIDVDVLGGVSDLAGRARGIGHASAGSFGASVGLSAGAWSVSAGVSAGFTSTVNQTYTALADLNGDGLPDQVAKRREDAFFLVRFNLGDRFAEETVRLYRPEWDVSLLDVLRDRVSADLGVIDDALGGLPGGFSLPGFTGLPGNAANRFGSEIDPFAIADVLEYTSGVAFSAGANVTVSINFWLVALEITPGVNGSYATTSATMRLADIDGDGLPDHVLKIPGDEYVRVKLNAAGKSGLLRSVALPQGGTIALDYERAGNTVAMPQSRWVLASVARDDGLAGSAPDRGVHRVTERYAYAGGRYDRGERLFCGFAEVAATLGDGSARITRYANASLHTRGMAVETRVVDRSGAVVAETTSRIRQRDEGSYAGREVVFPAVTEETRRLYEAGTERCVETGMRWEYDDSGNVSRVDDLGNTAVGTDDLVATIRYASLGEQLRCHPERIRVVDGSGRLLRQRRGSYGGRGELVALERWRTESESHVWRVGHDRYGNLASVADPRGYTVAWTYDDDAHAFPRTIVTSNPSLGGPSYESRIEWDPALAAQTARIDVAGSRISMSHDSFGRLLEVHSPYDTGATAAVVHEYRTTDFPWIALTRNKLRFDSADGSTLATAVTVDGLGRVVQTAREAEVWDDGFGAARAGWICGGAVAYDARGRAAAEGQPVFVEGVPLPPLAAVTRPTLLTWDALDRVAAQQLPDGSRWTTAYLVPAARAVEAVTDPLGRVTEREFDGRGAVVAVRRLGAAGAVGGPLPSTPAVLASAASGAGAVLTGAAYTYNGLGELLEAVDFAGNRVVRSDYDLLGRRVRLESPDAGVVDLAYDESGNLARKTDSVLRARGESIGYRYDGHNRLVEVDYPRIADTRYVYGGPGAPDNAAGRLVEREDDSGVVAYRYGKLGETVAVSRTIPRLTALAADVQASFAYLSDYLGRLERITYPDGEVVTYEYDRGGQVASVTGVHGGRSTRYVQRAGYDAFGQRIFVRYGNGVESRYSYDPERRWLESIGTTGPWGQLHQDVDYRLDVVGNILGVANSTALSETRQGYAYDDLDQLVHASGTTTARPHGVPEYTSTYAQDFAFDSIANLTLKRSTIRTTPAQAVGAPLSYDFDYAYCTDAPHRAERIGGLWYRYDANGNVAEEREGGHGSGPLDDAAVAREGDVRIVNRGFGLTRGDTAGSGYERRFVWDEENRLRRVVEGDRAVHFRYGADGRRCVKYSAEGETLYFDALWQVSTDYPDLRRSKHIYVGSSRIATRLNIEGHSDLGYEELNTYYYHGDHLGSASVVTDYRGEAYERVEYTPYGEPWVEEKSDAFDRIPFRFTGKEWDEETQLYYYGARYLDPRTSRWMSADPAQEGVNWYGYARNNSVVYVDPDGRESRRYQIGKHDVLPYWRQTYDRWTDYPLGVLDNIYNPIAYVFNFASNVYGYVEEGYNAATEAAFGSPGISGEGLSTDLMLLGLYGAINPGDVAAAGRAIAYLGDKAAGALAGGGSAGTEETIVVGESMQRVQAFARELEGKGVRVRTYQAPNMNRPANPNAYGSAESLDANRHWLDYWARKRGATVYDIGRQPGRTTPSPYYSMESRSLSRWELSGEIRPVIRVDPGY